MFDQNTKRLSAKDFVKYVGLSKRTTETKVAGSVTIIGEARKLRRLFWLWGSPTRALQNHFGNALEYFVYCTRDKW